VVSAALRPDPVGLAAPARQRTEIALRDVCVRYPVSGSTLKTVLSCVDLEISAGEFVVVLGETGCGKSTLLRLILGEEFPTSGSVTVDGKPVTRIDSRSGYVPQKYSLFPDRTVLGNVMYGPENGCSRVLGRIRPSFRRFRRSLKSEARMFLERMGLRAQDMDKYPHQLSGGMQQRVAIAQALMMLPPVLLMDEAFSALDPSTRGGLQEQLHALWLETRPTVVFVTHNTSEALLLGTRLVLLGRHHEEDASKSNVVLDLELPTSRLPFARRKQSLEFQELRERVKLLAYKSSSMNREEGPVEFAKAADPQ
jgi:NitT/TauT family transport system ATP-binding protein